MDMAFLQRARRMLGESHPARLDHGLLLASLIAGRRQGRPEARPEAFEQAIVEVILAGPRWREAALAQRGCFSRAEAGLRANDA